MDKFIQCEKWHQGRSEESQCRYRRHELTLQTWNFSNREIDDVNRNIRRRLCRWVHTLRGKALQHEQPQLKHHPTYQILQWNPFCCEAFNCHDAISFILPWKLIGGNIFVDLIVCVPAAISLSLSFTIWMSVPVKTHDQVDLPLICLKWKWEEGSEGGSDSVKARDLL